MSKKARKGSRPFKEKMYQQNIRTLIADGQNLRRLLGALKEEQKAIIESSSMFMTAVMLEMASFVDAQPKGFELKFSKAELKDKLKDIVLDLSESEDKQYYIMRLEDKAVYEQKQKELMREQERAHNVALAEQSLLGCMILDNELISKVANQIGYHDFTVEVHELVYEKIIDIYVNDGKVDITTLTKRFTQEQLTSFGGVEYLSYLATSIPNTDEYRRYMYIMLSKLDMCQCDECMNMYLDERKIHESCCAVHSEPAEPKGECNCGEVSIKRPKGLENKAQSERPDIREEARGDMCAGKTTAESYNDQEASGNGNGGLY